MGVKVAKKGAKAAVKGGESFAVKLPKTTKELDETMQELLGKIPVADAMVCVAGFYAGYQGMTPMTMIMGGLKGFGAGVSTVTTVVGSVAFDPTNILRNLVDKVAEEKKEAVALQWKLTMACIGLIEAYMITRPGALAAVGNLAAAMTQAGIDIFKELWPL